MKYYVCMVTFCSIHLAISNTKNVNGTLTEEDNQNNSQSNVLSTSATKTGWSAMSMPLPAGTIRNSKSKQRHGSPKINKNTGGATSKNAMENYQKREQKRKQKVSTSSPKDVSENKEEHLEEKSGPMFNEFLKSESSRDISDLGKSEKSSELHAPSKTLTTDISDNHHSRSKASHVKQYEKNKSVQQEIVLEPVTTESVPEKMSHKQNIMKGAKVEVSYLKSPPSFKTISERTNADEFSSKQINSSAKSTNSKENTSTLTMNKSSTVVKPVVSDINYYHTQKQNYALSDFKTRKQTNTWRKSDFQNMEQTVNSRTPRDLSKKPQVLKIYRKKEETSQPVDFANKGVFHNKHDFNIKKQEMPVVISKYEFQKVAKMELNANEEKARTIKSQDSGDETLLEFSSLKSAIGSTSVEKKINSSSSSNKVCDETLQSQNFEKEMLNSNKEPHPQKQSDAMTGEYTITLNTFDLEKREQTSNLPTAGGRSEEYKLEDTSQTANIGDGGVFNNNFSNNKKQEIPLVMSKNGFQKVGKTESKENEERTITLTPLDSGDESSGLKSAIISTSMEKKINSPNSSNGICDETLQNQNLERDMLSNNPESILKSQFITTPSILEKSVSFSDTKSLSFKTTSSLMSDTDAEDKFFSFSEEGSSPQSVSDMEEQTTVSSKAQKSEYEKKGTISQSSNPSEAILNSAATSQIVNTLLIVPNALNQMEKSNIKLNNFGVTALIKLVDGGVIIKCDSKEQVYKLQKAIFDDLETLNINLTYFFAHIVGIYDVPKSIINDEISSIIVQKYKQKPLNVHFMPYKSFWKSDFKIALLDVNNTLLKEIKASPTVQIEEDFHEIQVLLEEQLDFKTEVSTPLGFLSSPSQNLTKNIEVLMNNLPNDVNEIEISHEICQKFEKSPLRIQIEPSPDKSGEKLAKLEVDRILQQKIALSPFVWIRWNNVKIQTPSMLQKCPKCHSFHHMSKFCIAKSDDNKCVTKITDVNSPRRFKEEREMSAEASTSRTQSSKTFQQSLTADVCTTIENEIEPFRDKAFSYPETFYTTSPKTAEDEVFLDLIGNSVEKTLTKILPHVLNAVDLSVHQTLAKVLPNASVSNENSSTALSFNHNRRRETPFYQGDTINSVPTTPQTPNSPLGNHRAAVLIRPMASTSDVTKELGNMNIKSRNIFIDHAIFYPWKDVLLICNSIENANDLRYIISRSSKLKLLQWRGIPIRVRIDSIPSDITADEISSCLFDKYNELPKEIKFLYKNPMKPNTKLAMLNISESLLKKIDISPSIEIQGNPLTIDTTVRVPRCFNCQLLGHRQDICSMNFQRKPLFSQKCLDCCYYNSSLRETKFNFRPRDENHQTNGECCPSKLAILDQLNGRVQRERNLNFDEKTFNNLETNPFKSDKKIITNSKDLDFNRKRSKVAENSSSNKTIERTVDSQNKNDQTVDEEKLENSEFDEEGSSDERHPLNIIL